jgi:hypothetical protein
MMETARTWRPDKRVAWRAVDGRMVLVGGHEGKLFVLNETGTRLWELVCNSASVDDMASALESGFEVTAKTARKDVLTFLDQMHDRGLAHPMES